MSAEPEYLNIAMELTEKAELSALGITVLDQSALEKDVEKKVDAALAEHSQKQKLNILEKELRQVSADIETAQKTAAKLDDRLQGTNCRIMDPKRYVAAEKEAVQQRDHMDELQCKLADIRRELDEADTMAVGNSDLEEGEIAGDREEEESERDRLIRLGEITPFGAAALTAVRPLVQPLPRGSGILLSALQSSTNVSQADKSSGVYPIEARKGHSQGAFTATSDSKTPVDVINKKRDKKSDILHRKQIVSKGLTQYFEDQLKRQQEHLDQPKHRKVDTKHSLYDLIDKKKKLKNRKKGKAAPTCSHDSTDETDSGSDRDHFTDGTETFADSLSVSKSSRRKVRPQPKKQPRLLNLGTLTRECEWRRREAPRKMLSEVTEFDGGDIDEETEEEDHSDVVSEYMPSDGDEGESDDVCEEDDVVNDGLGKLKTGRKRQRATGVGGLDGPSRKKEKKRSKLDSSDKSGLMKKRSRDDSKFKIYKKRLERWRKEKLIAKLKLIEENDSPVEDEDESKRYETLGYGMRVPTVVWSQLYRYQQTGVRWLWELHEQGCGGILGDEMGLGKTVQVIAFLAGLRCGNLERPHSWSTGGPGMGPVLIVCPATLLHQWLSHFHLWWPPFRVAILHSSGGYTGDKQILVHNINKDSGVLITSYSGVKDTLDCLLAYTWHYIILDEGHKIRNPDAQITLAVKKFNTPHRLILSGSPIQNSLKELWSLFDFVFPGKLGTLQVFLQQFAVPITQGGYANASRVEVETGFKCAVMLRDTISPYLLRRMKADVKSHLSLPNKSEQVLFCGLTEEQRSLYKGYLDGDQVSNIMNGRLKVFVGLINLRKLCNHPDLYTGGTRLDPGETAEDLPEKSSYGWWEKSGKMQVVHGVLQLWKRQSHRVLLFTQSAQMLIILEKYLQQQNYSYLKMDGKTLVGSRQGMVQRFNSDASLFVFLLTTRVGGLGVNLTGADRVLIYDPDWNPSTDIQARERAWRIGQQNSVTIYRLLTAGTIEEKIYHRQIFKQFLTNRVLKDPKQQRFFKTNDLFELFTLNEGKDEKTESSALFAGLGSDVTPGASRKKPSLSDAQQASNSQMRSDRKGKAARTQKTTTRNKSSSNESKPNQVTGAVVSRVEDSTSGPVVRENKLESYERNSHDSRVKFKIPKSSEYLHQTPEMSNALKDTIPKSDVPSVHQENSSGNAVEGGIDNTETPLGVEEVGSFADVVGLPIGNRDVESSVQETQGNASLVIPESEGVENIEKQVRINAESLQEISKPDGPSMAQSEDASKGETGIGQKILNAPACRVETEVVEDLEVEKSNLDLDKKREQMRMLAKMLSRKIGNKSSVSLNISRSAELNSSTSADKRIIIDDELKQSKKTEVRKEKRGKKFEGERIEYLVKKKKCRPSAAEVEREKNKSQDEYVLSKLFKSSGVHSALSHDVITNAGDPDYMLLEAEADRVAKEAMEVVRSSRSQCFTPSLIPKPATEVPKKRRFGKVTQTKFTSHLDVDESSLRLRSGHSNGSQEQLANFNGSQLDGNQGSSGMMSSAQLLQRMKNRQLGVNTSSIDGTSSGPNSPAALDSTTAANVELLSDIRNFVAFQATRDGRASTQEIVDRFRNRLPNDKSHVFKALLKEICEFRREADKQGMWYIKREFQ